MTWQLHVTPSLTVIMPAVLDDATYMHVGSVLCRKSFDLGQFERFRRIMHTPYYRTLLNHQSVSSLSTLQVSHQSVQKATKTVPVPQQPTIYSCVSVPHA